MSTSVLQVQRYPSSLWLVTHAPHRNLIMHFLVSLAPLLQWPLTLACPVFLQRL